MSTDDTSLQNLLAEMALLKAQMARLEAQLSLPPTLLPASTTPIIAKAGAPLVVTHQPLARRKALKRMAAVMLGGAIVGAASLSSPQPAEAKVIANPTTNGMINRVGTFITPPGAAAPANNLPGSAKYGMIVSGTTTALDLNTLPAFATNNSSYGVLAVTDSGYAVFGHSTNNVGVYGNSNAYIGVYGESVNDSGVRGTSTNSIGVYGSSTNNPGVYGFSAGSRGVFGEGTTGRGVYGKSTSGEGVLGISTSYYGVSGTSTDSSGVYGTSSGTVGAGVYGFNPGNAGVFGESTTGYGVFGISDTGTGVSGVSGGNSSRGVSGVTYSGFDSRGLDGRASGQNCRGVSGMADGENSRGVIGEATGTLSRGVSGIATGTNSSAGYFEGNVTVTGGLVKASGSFKIDHPTDPANKYLYHSFVESPDMLNIYNGNVTLDEDGQATIAMLPWFEALNKDFRYQLTPIGGASPNLHISLKLNNGSFTIGGGTEGQEVSWQVTGIRQDAYANAHRIPVEEDKAGQERGKYLHPEAHGQTAEAGINFERNKVENVAR